MNLIQYVTDLFASGRMGAYISLGILSCVLVFVLSGIIFGVTRGLGKTTVRLITILLSAVAAFFIVGAAARYIEGMFVGKTLNELILTYMPSYESDVPENWRNLINCFDAETAERLILIVVYLVAVPVVFIVCFYALKLVTVILYWILAAVLGMMGRRRTLFSSLMGMAVGAVQGLLISVVILLPVSGFAAIAGEVRAPLTGENVPVETRAQIDEFYGWWLDDVIENPALTAIGNMGGKALFGSMITAHIGEEEVNMGEEAKTLAHVYVDAQPLIGADWTAPDETAKQSLRNILADVGDDGYTASIISGILRGAAKAVDTGALVVPMDEPYKSLITDITGIFLDSNKDNLKGDLTTILNIYFILTDNGILSSLGDGEGQDVIDLLIGDHNGERVITKVLGELDANPRTKPISDALTKITIVAMSSSLGLSDDATEVFENVTTGVQGILAIDPDSFETEEEYKGSVTTLLDSTLSDNGIELEEEILDGMAQYIVDHRDEMGDTVTDMDINNALLSYYDAYADYVANGGTVPEP